MQLYTLYVGIGYTKHGNIIPHKQVDDSLDRARRDITALTGGLTESWCHGRSVECPGGEQSIVFTTLVTNYADIAKLDDIAAVLRENLEQGSIMRTITPTDARFI